uniref:Chloride intracellular channel 6 n=1 Tax=Lates calcarifer TaxID=8187 RepID=A0A4W6GA10_LATCA
MSWYNTVVKKLGYPTIELFVKAGSDGESIGNCPFSQRLFMILWLKGVIFNVTTVDLKRTWLQEPTPPFVTFNGEVKVDVNMIEEFLEEKLTPPTGTGNTHSLEYSWPEEAFQQQPASMCSLKFSAYIKNPRKDTNDALEKALLKSLRRLDDFLRTPLPEEIDAYASGDLPESSQELLDGSQLTLADCNLLPKLHILRFIQPDTHIWTVTAREEFTNTCPAEREIEFAYLDVAKRIK